MYKKISKQLIQTATDILESIDYEVSDDYDIYYNTRSAYNTLDDAMEYMTKHIAHKEAQELDRVRLLLRKEKL